MSIFFFLARLVRSMSPFQIPNLTVKVYTRAQCCCCHQALEVLKESQRRLGFSIETVDVDTDPELAERHGLFVPVVEVNGKVRFKGTVNPALFERLVLMEGRGERREAGRREPRAKSESPNLDSLPDPR